MRRRSFIAAIVLGSLALASPSSAGPTCLEHEIGLVRPTPASHDRRATPAGEAFACRYEAILSDERQEKRKTRWRVQLNFKLAD